MKFNQIGYLVNESLRAIKRHKGISAISVVIMSLTLLILAVFLLATDNMLMFMSRAKQEMRVYAYLEDTVSQNALNDYHRSILSMPEVDQVIFVSKAQALHEFQTEIGDETNLLEVLESNPLPASFRITLKDEYKDKDKIVRFAGQLQELDGVEDVVYGKDFLEKFAAITRGFFFVDAFIGVIVILSSVFIISNAVRLSVVSRLQNIEILKLVGATNRFITMPFIMEGAMQGAIASLISTALLFAIYLVGARFLPDLAFFSTEKTVIYIALCVFIGSLGSFTALRRFLKG